MDYNDTPFFDKLGLTYISDGAEQEIVQLDGYNESITQGLSFTYLGGYDPHYSVDQLSPNGSELLFSSEDGYGRMFMKEDEGYQTISSSIVLGALAPGDSLNLKPFLLAEMVNTFLGYNPSTSLQEVFSGLIKGTNYPNPFNGKTTIEYTLSEAGQVKIDVYDLSGKVIKQLLNDEFLPGSYSITWDATNEEGTFVRDGFYFFKVSQGKHAVTEKMVLLR